MNLKFAYLGRSVLSPIAGGQLHEMRPDVPTITT